MNGLFRSFSYAFRGIRMAMRQRNLRIQTGVALLVIAAGLYFEINVTDWCVVLLTIALVIGLEMVNSSFEAMVDLVSPEVRPQAARVKDMAAGAVLTVAAISIIIGFIVFYPYLAALYRPT